MIINNFNNFLNESNNLKMCNRCGGEKNINDFYKNGSSHRPECKKCTNLVNKKYRLNNKEFIKELKRKYHKSEKGRETDRIYYTNYRKNMPDSVKDKIKKSHRVWCHNQYNNNNKYKLVVSIRNLIGKCFRGKTKSKSTEDILGCSIEQFRIYIENQFTNGMCWENQGEWHLDHIIPVSWASTDEEVYKLNHYNNFKPMWGIDNIKKGNKFSENG